MGENGRKFPCTEQKHLEERKWIEKKPEDCLAEKNLDDYGGRIKGARERMDAYPAPSKNSSGVRPDTGCDNPDKRSGRSGAQTLRRGDIKGSALRVGKYERAIQTEKRYTIAKTHQDQDRRLVYSLNLLHLH